MGFFEDLLGETVGGTIDSGIGGIGDLFGIGGDDQGGGGGIDLGGLGTVLQGLGGLGQQLIGSGVTEEQLELQRDQLEALERQRGVENLLASDKLDLDKRRSELDLALLALKAAQSAVPDRSQELGVRSQQIAQAGQDARTNIDVVDRIVGRFSNAVR